MQLNTRVSDEATRNNFVDIENRLSGTVVMRGKVITKFFDKPGKNIVIHRLGYVPEDVVVTKNAHLVKVDWQSVNNESITLMVSKACTVKAYVGTISNG